MGYGAIHIIGKEIKLLAAGVISLQKIKDHPLKLKKIFERTIELIAQFKPDELAIESQFFGKNVQSMLKLGRAQGIAIAAALVRNIPIFEYSPKKIKQSVTGNGNASKEQVASMLQKILTPPKGLASGRTFEFSELRYLDATDALGVAMCHYFSNRELVEVVNSGKHKHAPALPLSKGKAKASKKKFSGWESFLSENPNRQLNVNKKST